MDSSSLNTQNIFREYNRFQIWEIWEAGKRGDPLEGESSRMFQVMKEHPEHYALWDRLNLASDAEIMQGEANLVLHITFHTVVENQLMENNPPAVAQVLNVLMQKGLSRHEAVHLIAGAVAWEIYNALQRSQPFEEIHYLRELRRLPLQVKSKPKRKK